MGFVATQACAKGKVFRIYCGTLIYKTVLDTLNTRKVYKDGVMRVTHIWFDVSTVRLTEQVSCSDEKYHTFSVIRARFACFQFVNVSRFH